MLLHPCAGPLVALIAVVFAVQASAVIPEQRARSWPEIKSPTSWSDMTVPIVISGSATTPSRLKSQQAKSARVEVPYPTRFSSLVAIGDSHTDTSYVVLAGTFYSSDKAGVRSFQVVSGFLFYADSFVHVPGVTAVDRAIGQFANEFTPARVSAAFENRPQVPLGPAPPDFFLAGSIHVDAELQKFDIQDGILHLQLRSHGGTIGTFWVDLQKRTVVKTEFRNASVLRALV